MKNIEELRKMMKSKKYSGSITERDPAYIKEVENGFKALFPLREIHPEKVPEEIRAERDARQLQHTTINLALDETKAQLALLERQIDKVEQTGKIKNIREHLLLMEETRLFLNILADRQVRLSNLSNEANRAYEDALERTHDCFGCKWLMHQQGFALCGAGYNSGAPAIPTAEITTCPDTQGQMLDQDRPVFHRLTRDLPSHGIG